MDYFFVRALAYSFLDKKSIKKKKIAERLLEILICKKVNQNLNADVISNQSKYQLLIPDLFARNESFILNLKVISSFNAKGIYSKMKT